MSLEAVQRVIFLATTNEEFRSSLKANPDQFLQDKELTSDEVSSLKAMDWDSVASAGRDLEQRVSRMGFAMADCH